MGGGELPPVPPLDETLFIIKPIPKINYAVTLDLGLCPSMEANSCPWWAYVYVQSVIWDTKPFISRRLKCMVVWGISKIYLR